MSEDNAALKIQAVQRGRLARREMRERQQAATKIQSVHRGRQQRKAMKEKDQAAIKIQSVHRGRAQRKKGQVSQYDWVANSKNDMTYGGLAQGYSEMSAYMPMPVAEVANNVQQPYPMHVVHQQNTTHYLTYPGPGGMMPPPITANILSNASQPQQQQQFGMNSYASPTTTNVYYQVPMQQPSSTANMIQDNSKANLPSAQQPMPQNDHQQYLGKIHTSLPPPSGGFPSNVGTVPPVPPFAFERMPDLYTGMETLSHGQMQNQKQQPQQPYGSHRSYNSPKQKFQRKQKNCIDKKVEYSTKEQTRKRRGFKSGFRVVEPSQIEASEFQCPESKERERKQRNKAGRGKNVQKPTYGKNSNDRSPRKNGRTYRMTKPEGRNRESKNRNSKVRAEIAHPNKLVSNRKYRSSNNSTNGFGKSQYRNSNLRPQRPSDTDNKSLKQNYRKSRREQMSVNNKNTMSRRVKDSAKVYNRSKGRQRADSTTDVKKLSKTRENNVARNADRGKVKKQNRRVRNPADWKSKRG